jgi:hypothetical protein
VWVSMAQPAQHPRPEQSRACHRSFFTGCWIAANESIQTLYKTALH